MSFICIIQELMQFGNTVFKQRAQTQQLGIWSFQRCPSEAVDKMCNSRLK